MARVEAFGESRVRFAALSAAVYAGAGAAAGAGTRARDPGVCAWGAPIASVGDYRLSNPDDRTGAASADRIRCTGVSRPAGAPVARRHRTHLATALCDVAGARGADAGGRAEDSDRAGRHPLLS